MLAVICVVRHAGVLVADGGGEEFEEAAAGLVAAGGDQARHQLPRPATPVGGRDLAATGAFDSLSDSMPLAEEGRNGEVLS
jgi:hypothetical protein